MPVHMHRLISVCIDSAHCDSLTVKATRERMYMITRFFEKSESVPQKR